VIPSAGDAPARDRPRRRGPARADAAEPWLSRERVLALTLIALTAVAVYLCYRLLVPFLPMLAWALALALVTHPMHRAICRRIRQPDVAAGVAVAVVAIAVVAPAVLVGRALVARAVASIPVLERELASGHWREVVERSPWIAAALGWIERELDLPALAGRAGEAAGGWVPSILAGSAWTAAGLLITLFVLYFFFRDARSILGVLRSLVPLSHAETDEVFARVADTVHATVYGSLTVALVQGAMGGLMFWVLGLPAPVFWGAVMALLAVVPMLGTFIVWGPAALLLALSGEWLRALVLVAWGACAIGLIDNLLYPFLVGHRMRLHTLPVFFALLGGIAFMGAAGVVLGPLVLAATDALFDVWRRRLAWSGTAETGVEYSEAAGGRPPRA
jgi:predicted PurR-regulated permease PerM